MLLEHGDYMSDPVGTDCSAIHVAAYSGQANMIELLLDHGAHVDGTCIPHHQVTPLGEAACCGREAAVVVLLDHRAILTPRATMVLQFLAQSSATASTE